MAKTRKKIEENQEEQPVIVRLVNSPFEVTAQMTDRHERIIIRGQADENYIRAVSKRFEELSDGETRYDVKTGQGYVDCRRIA